MEKYEGDASKTQSTPALALQEIIEFALRISALERLTGMTSPTVIT